MHEPPSEQLVRQLAELQLCGPRDFLRARARVRRLSYDLPAFDSVWIDSLVQLKRLTPYQAHQLEQGQGDRLRVGSLVAIDELGRSPSGATYLARRLNRRDRVVFKRQRVSPDRLPEVRLQMTTLLERLKGFAHPQIVVPQEMIPTEADELVVVSRFVPGLTLTQMLVRRGRFPAAVVLEIARQLMEGMSALKAKSFLHGDIRLSNIRLTDRGLAVLINASIRPILYPQVTIHDQLAVDAYDGLAPELIGTGASVTAKSEMYALGCVLWQLLAGRPPYVSADPLAKIAAHQTQTIEDVRVWAPDTPAKLAESIRQLTAPKPEERPRSFEEVLQHWGPAGLGSRSQLRRFLALFDGAVPHFSRPVSAGQTGKFVWISVALLAGAGGVALLSDQGLRTELLNVARRVESFGPTSGGRSTELLDKTISDQQPSPDGRPIAEMVPLPSPSAAGVILLTGPGPYQASSITFAGKLTIRGSVGNVSEIRIDNDPLSLTASEVTFEHVLVRRVMTTPLPAMVTVRSDRLFLRNCEFLGPSQGTEAGDGSDLNSPVVSQASGAVGWMSQAGRDGQEGEIEIHNTRFHGDGVSVLLAQTPRSIRIENTLKTGVGSLLALGPKTVSHPFLVDLEKVTLRESGPLLRVAGEAASNGGADSIQVRARHCVFKLNGTTTPLMLVDSQQRRPDLAHCLEVKGIDSVVEPGTVRLALLDRERNRQEEIDADEQFEDLIASEIKFAGPEILSTDDARTHSIQGPRMSDASQPGIDPQSIGPDPLRRID